MEIPFRKVYSSTKEVDYLKQTISNTKVSGGGDFSKRCDSFILNRHQLAQEFLTNSCTTVLDSVAYLSNIKDNVKLER